MSASKPHFEPDHLRFENTNTGLFQILEACVFIDEDGKRWEAPTDTLTDGASIPQIFLSFTGSEMGKDVFAAAIVHDAFCGVDNNGGTSYHSASWQHVHRMFYEGLLACGAAKLKALTLYAAVRLGGPRWEIGTGNDVSLTKTVKLERLEEEMRACVNWIKQKDPSIDEVDEWMEQREPQLLLPGQQVVS